MLWWENIINFWLFQFFDAYDSFTSLLLSIISLLDYLCHSTLAVTHISQNNYTLLQYLDRILSYHLGFSFLISTLLFFFFFHENASSFTYFLFIHPGSLAFHLLSVSKSQYIAIQLPDSKLRKKKYCHPGGLLFSESYQSQKTQILRQINWVILRLHSHFIPKLTEPYWFYLTFSKKSISITFTIILSGHCTVWNKACA